MKKYSIIELSLLAVSAITATFAPSKASGSRIAIDGIMDLSTGRFVNFVDLTCRERLFGEHQANCSFTNTGLGNLSSTDFIFNSHSLSLPLYPAEPGSLSATTAIGIE